MAVTKDCSDAVLLNEAEAHLARLLDGRTVSSALAELGSLQVNLSLGAVLDVCERLAAAGLVEDADAVHAGLTGRVPARRFARWLDLELFRLGVPAADIRRGARVPWPGAT